MLGPGRTTVSMKSSKTESLALKKLQTEAGGKFKRQLFYSMLSAVMKGTWVAK